MNNTPILVPHENEMDPLEIAKKELYFKKIPLMIRRYLPDGSCEDWNFRELIIPVMVSIYICCASLPQVTAHAPQLGRCVSCQLRQFFFPSYLRIICFF